MPPVLPVLFSLLGVVGRIKVGGEMIHVKMPIVAYSVGKGLINQALKEAKFSSMCSIDTLGRCWGRGYIYILFWKVLP